jgi:hypothetical protein
MPSFASNYDGSCKKSVYSEDKDGKYDSEWNYRKDSLFKQYCEVEAAIAVRIVRTKYSLRLNSTSFACVVIEIEEPESSL